MRKVISLSISIVILSSCATLKPHPRKWTSAEKACAGFFIATHLANAYTTERAQDHPQCDEVNPALGEHPSDSKTIVYFSFTGLVALTLSHFYPNLRKPLLIGYGVVNTGLAINDLDRRNETRTYTKEE